MVTFTVPEELRDVLRIHRREGYEALMKASSRALMAVAASIRTLKDVRLGFFGVLHTWGRDPMVYHPRRALRKEVQPLRYLPTSCWMTWTRNWRSVD